MTARSNPTDRSKLGKAKRHILTDKKGILLSVVISSASTHDIKLVTNVVDNVVIHKRPSPPYKTKTTVRERRRRKLQHLCLDKAYNSKPEEQELINRGYVPHIPPKREKEMKQRKRKRSRLQHNIAQIGKSILQKDGGL
jgi:IS5 family transposase